MMCTARYSKVRIILATVAIAAIAGCGENKPASSSEAPAPLERVVRLPTNAPNTPLPPTDAGSSPLLPRQVIGQPVASEHTQAASVPQVPADAQWTIFCCAVQGLGHVEGANEAKASLVRKTGRGDWYVIHGGESSNIYFGFYASVDPLDKKNSVEVSRSKADMKLVAELRDSQGNLPFARSGFIALESPDPSTSNEWNLFNVDRSLPPQDPKRAYWTLQILAFRGDQKRKEAAVDAVKKLRAQGVEAYYYHGDTVSSVCVGHWPPSAVKEQDRNDKSKETAIALPGTPLVVTSEAISDDMKAKPIDGQRAMSATPKLEIVDRSMLAMQANFPNHAVNYDIGVKRTKKGDQVLDPSFLVTIPRAKGNGLYDSMDLAGPAIEGKGAPVGPSMITPRERTIGSSDGRR